MGLFFVFLELSGGRIEPLAPILVDFGVFHPKFDWRGGGAFQ